MIALVLAALAVPAAPAPLEQAQEAFGRQDYPAAETLALAAAQPPQAGAALYLVGLARFRTGRFEEALEALQAAGAATDPPARALWHYNLGACLTALGRPLEAEAESLDAASFDASIAGLALVNAAWAALDGGSPERARVWAARARERSSAEVDALLAELDARLASSFEEQATAAYRAGLQAFDAGRYGDALGRFRRAAELDPRDGRSRIMSGAAALQLGARGEARSQLEQALSLPLDDVDARTARDYLDAASRGGPGLGKGWEGTVRASGGADSNALQTGIFQSSERPMAAVSAGATPSATLDGGVGLWWRTQPADGASTELGYTFDQLAYLAAPAADRSFQLHELTAALEVSLREHLRVGARATGQLAFAGLSSFRGLQGALGAGAWALLDESDSTATRLDLDWSHKDGIGAEFAYLSGDRLDAALSQEVRLGPAALALGFRLRGELIGSTATRLVIAPEMRGRCFAGCLEDITVPYDYLGNTLWLSARAGLGPRLEVELSGGVEWRSYLSDNVSVLTPNTGAPAEVDGARRHDQRWFGSASLSLRLARALKVTLTYDLLVNRSDLAAVTAAPGMHPEDRCGAAGTTCGQLDYDKHAVTLGTSLSW